MFNDIKIIFEQFPFLRFMLHLFLLLFCVTVLICILLFLHKFVDCSFKNNCEESDFEDEHYTKTYDELPKCFKE